MNKKQLKNLEKFLSSLATMILFMFLAVGQAYFFVAGVLAENVLLELVSFLSLTIFSYLAWKSQEVKE